MLLNANEHIGIGLAQRDVGTATRGMLQTTADGTAVDQHGPLIGGAYAVGIGGYVGQTLRNPPRGTAQARVDERHVEGGYHHVGHVVGTVGCRNVSGLLKLRNHAGRTQQEEAAGRGIMGLQIVDGGHGGGVHLLLSGFNAHLMELEQIVIERLRGIIGQKTIGNAHLAQAAKEGDGEREQGVAHINSTIHVEGYVANAGQALFQFGSHDCVLVSGFSTSS